VAQPARIKANVSRSAAIPIRKRLLFFIKASIKNMRLMPAGKIAVSGPMGAFFHSRSRTAGNTGGTEKERGCGLFKERERKDIKKV
jgi:hypothetical protein